MRVHIVAIGKLKAGAERELLSRYVERIGGAGRGVALGPLAVTEISESRAGSAARRMAEEAAALVEKSDGADLRILLDERGKAISSRAFADQLRAWRDRPSASIAFLIGGADGHGEAARMVADTTLSLGPMTLPHGLARVVLAEQIYRAVTILSGHPYHRE